MPHWRTMIEKDYLGSWDLVDRDGVTPKDWTLKIKSVQSQLLKTKENPKGRRRCVITFHGARKQFVANPTNCETIESMYGPDTNGWVDRSLTLYQTDVKNPKGKGTVKGIRIRPRVPQGAAETIVEREVDPTMRAEQNEAFGRGEREPGEEG